MHDKPSNNIAVPRDVFIDLGEQLVRLSNIRTIIKPTRTVCLYDGTSVTCTRDISKVEGECFVYMLNGAGNAQTFRPLLSYLAAQWMRRSKKNYVNATLTHDPIEKAKFDTRATNLFGCASELQELESTLAAVCTGSGCPDRSRQLDPEPSSTEHPA